MISVKTQYLNPLWALERDFQSLHSLMYESLIRLNDDYEPEPYIATDWLPSNDCKSWTFRLRDDVYFSDGTQLTAYDVAATVNEILRLAKEGGRGIEINTWKGQTLSEWIPVLKMYRELGGEIITVGSDAHAPDPIARGVPEAYRMMKDCGFRYVAVYHERKPDFIKL